MLLEIQNTIGELKKLGLADLFAEMTEERLEQRHQTQEMDTGDEAILDVPNDDDHELFVHYMKIDDTHRETIWARGVRVIKRPAHLDDYGI